MNRYSTLLQRLHNGATIIIDGGTGTEVERHGVPKLKDAWNGGAALSHPDILQRVHRDYINAGAEVIISNTFATSRHALRDAGEEENFVAYNRRGVELACAARAEADTDQVLVAGGISFWSWSERHPTLEELTASTTEQAQIMRDAGADLIMLEMMIDIRRMCAILKGVQHAGLPIWVGFTCGGFDQKAYAAKDVPTLRNGDLLLDALAALDNYKVDAVNIMHTDVNLVARCLDVVAANWDRPYGAYAHSGDYNAAGDWLFTGVIDAGDYAAAAQQWLANGAQIIGGCCGIGPEHIVHLNNDVCSTSQAPAHPNQTQINNA